MTPDGSLLQCPRVLYVLPGSTGISSQRQFQKSISVDQQII